MIQIFGTTKCKGTRAALRFFSERGVKVHSIDLAEKGLSKGELTSVARATGGLVRLFDATSPRVKAKGLQYAAPNDERLLQLFLEDALLLRTPIVRSGQRACVGVDETAWKAFVEAEKKPT